MMCKHRLKCLFLFFVVTLDLCAIEGKVKLYVKNTEVIYTSQKVTIAVELITNAFSISDAKIPFPASTSYLVQAPKSAEYLRTVEINGTDWQMVHYEYQVYALKAGRVEIPSFPISFSASMGYGQTKKEFKLNSQVLDFEVKSPEGVKSNSFVLVSERYDLRVKMTPQKHQLMVGDAVEFSITQRAYGVPDILLKPFVYDSVAQLRVYSKEPLLESGLKGEYDVSRTDYFTFVATAEGNVTLKAQESLWWNSQSKKAQKETIKALTFEIIADPQIALEAKAKEQKYLLLFLLGLLVLFYLLYRLFTPSIQKGLAQKALRYEKSEKGRFETLLRYCEEEKTSVVYEAFYLWLKEIDDRLSKDGFRGVCMLQPSFCDILSEVEQLLNKPESIFSKEAVKTGFVKELHLLREVLLKKEIKIHGLQRLNPN